MIQYRVRNKITLNEIDRWSSNFPEAQTYFSIKYASNPDLELIMKDMTPDLEAEVQRRNQIAAIKQRLRTLASKTLAELTDAEHKEIVYRQLRLRFLNRDLD